MTITVIYTGPPVYWRARCAVCLKDITQGKRGRPRVYCSHACRQKRLRDAPYINSRARIDRKEDRAIERQLRGYERAKGKRIDDVTPIVPGTLIPRRYQLIFGMRAGRSLENCLWCGVPIVRENFGKGSRRRCCSRPCRKKFGEFVRHMKIALLHYYDSLDPVVVRRLRMYNFKTKRILPPIRTQAWLCEHCHKPFAATHLARKYCSKKCRQNAWYAARKPCQFCKRRFRPALHRGRAQMYCSEYCQVRGSYRKPPLAIPRNCLECGAEFIADRHNHTTKMYCSRRCAHKVALRRYRARKKAGRTKGNGILDFRMQNADLMATTTSQKGENGDFVPHKSLIRHSQKRRKKSGVFGQMGDFRHADL